VGESRGDRSKPGLVHDVRVADPLDVGRLEGDRNTGVDPASIADGSSVGVDLQDTNLDNSVVMEVDAGRF